jgi:2-phosphoglycerate kinase
LIIGGPPMAGKTTLGRKIAAERGWALISGDDLALAAKGVSTLPALHRMAGLDHREYYCRYSVDELIEHARMEHEALWGGMRKVILAHATWACPAVIEGWQFYPRRITEMNLANVEAMWLTPDEATLEARLRGSFDFYRGAPDEEVFIWHYLGRSRWHASRIAAELYRDTI